MSSALVSTSTTRQGVNACMLEALASANAVRRVEFGGTITCAIPGHSHPGQEWVSNLAANDTALQWRYEGRCGFATNFDYFN